MPVLNISRIVGGMELSGRPASLIPSCNAFLLLPLLRNRLQPPSCLSTQRNSFRQALGHEEHNMASEHGQPRQFNRWLVLAIVVIGNALNAFVMFSDQWDMD